MEEVLSNAISQIVIALIGLATSYIIFAIGKAKAKIGEATAQKITDENQKKLINDALDRVSLLAENIVLKTEQTSASAIRESVKDGKVDREELVVLGKQAVDDVYSLLSAETKTVLEQEIGDIQKYIESVVERTVLELKVK